MAEVDIPLGFLIDDLGLRFVKPSQIIHGSIYTRDVQVLERGPGSFEGVATLVPADRDIGATVGSLDFPGGSAIEAFFAQLEHRSNFCELPLSRPTVAIASTVTVASTAIVGGRVVVTLSSALNGLPGEYIRINDRLHMLSKVLSDTQWELEPQSRTLAPVGASVEMATSVRSRIMGEAPILSRTGGFWGPWTFTWQEYIG